MSALTCVRARLRLQERAAGLTAADALRLEEHLAGCDECRGQALLLDRLRDVAEQHDGSLSPLARERAIVGAFATVAQAHRQPARRPANLAWGVAAFALGAALFLWLRPFAQRDVARAPTAVPAAAAAAVGNAANARLSAGAVQIDGTQYEPGDVLPAGRAFATVGGAELQFGHARVSLRAATAVQWDPSAQVLTLQAGSVVADVDPAPHQRFSVRTARFSAVVLGTHFTVSLDEVQVERGRVQVVASDGRVLAAELTAGQRYRYSTEASVQPEPETITPATTGETTASAARGGHGASDPRALLQRAREGLAARDPGNARRAVDAALALRPGRELRAEALSLRAECALVEGDVATAVKQYLQVANGFGQLPAAQNALFAAARLQAEHGRQRDAADSFARYVARYPHGSLAEDAARRLRALSDAKPRER